MKAERKIDRLDKYIIVKGLNDNKITLDLGLSVGTIGKSRKDGRDLSPKVVEKILNFYSDLDGIWLMTGKGEMLKNPGSSQELAAAGENASVALAMAKGGVPLYDQPEALAGDDAELIPKGFLYLPNLPQCDGAVRMYGDRMSPAMNSGDVMVYRKVRNLERDPSWGQIYLLSFEIDGDVHIMVQRVRRADGEGNIRLVSENKNYPDTEIPRNSIKAMAQIMASVRYYNMM